MTAPTFNTHSEEIDWLRREAEHLREQVRQIDPSAHNEPKTLGEWLGRLPDFLWRLDCRVFEIVAAGDLFRRGALWWLELEPVQSPVYADFSAIAPLPLWGLALMLVGFFHFTAICINGTWHRTPILRFVSLAVTCMTYTSLAAGFYGFAGMSGVQSFTQEFWLGLCAYWAALNVVWKKL